MESVFYSPKSFFSRHDTRLGYSGLWIHGRQVPALAFEDRVIIAEAFHLWRERGDDVWPGWTSSAIPMIYIKGDFEYPVGHQSPPSEYTRLGHDSLLDGTIYCKKRELRENLAATWYVGEQKAVAIGTGDVLGKNPSQWVMTALHEMFHVYQGQRGSIEKVRTLDMAYGDDASWQLEFPFPYKDDILLYSVHTQANFAFISITAEQAFEGLYNSLSLIETLKTHKELIRLKYGDLKNYKYASFQEWTEGIAKYVELKMVRLAADGNYRPLGDFMDLDGYQSYKELQKNYYQRQFYAIRHCGKGVEGRNIFYYLGCAKGLLLDRVFPEWKKYYFEPDIWLDDILDLAVPVIQETISTVLQLGVSRSHEALDSEKYSRFKPSKMETVR